ncbi:hypothetical protein ACHAWC_005720 [Mediolabrus comicus]
MIGNCMMSSSSSSHQTLLQRIQALDKSHLAPSYAALVLFHPTPSSRYAVVGHAQKSFINSTLLQVKSENGQPIFVMEESSNKLIGTGNEILRLVVDIEYERNKSDSDMYNHDKLFHQRTKAFEYATQHLLQNGADTYPVYPLLDSTDPTNDDKAILAHVNRSIAAYLGNNSVGVHLNCYVTLNNEIIGVWLGKRAPTKSHHPNYWDTTVAGGQPHNLTLYENIVKEAHEEAGVPAEWLRNDASNNAFSDNTHDPLTMLTAKEDGSCLKRSFYYSFDLEVPDTWQPTAVDGEVSEFKLYSTEELHDELRFGECLRPAMRAVLLDFMIRHGIFRENKGEDDCSELSRVMRTDRISLW